MVIQNGDATNGFVLETGDIGSEPHLSLEKPENARVIVGMQIMQAAKWRLDKNMLTYCACLHKYDTY